MHKQSIALNEDTIDPRSEEHTSELQSRLHLVCRLLLEKKKDTIIYRNSSVDTATSRTLFRVHIQPGCTSSLPLRLIQSIRTYDRSSIQRVTARTLTDLV